MKFRINCSYCCLPVIMFVQNTVFRGNYNSKIEKKCGCEKYEVLPLRYANLSPTFGIIFKENSFPRNMFIYFFYDAS